MDNRQDMTHTREIDLLELLMTVLIHWRSMIVVMMCGVIVLGGMSYITVSYTHLTLPTNSLV